MKIASVFVTGMLSLGACATDGALEAGEDAPLVGKADGGDAIAFGEYVNEDPFEGAITQLVLTRANPQDLPHPYFEGHYTLEERRANDEETTSSGHFNVYTYAGQQWIRFLDEETGQYDTAFPRYSWVYLEDPLGTDHALVMAGVDADDEFILAPRFVGTKIGCSLRTLHDEEVFGVDFSAEDPNASVKRDLLDGRIQVRLGSMTWDSASGAAIELVAAADGTATTTITEGADRFVITGPTAATGPGKVMRVRGSTSTLVATLRCAGTTTGG